MFQCKLSKKLSFHVMLLFHIPGNPSKRQKTCDNHSSPLHSPPVKHSFSGFPAPVSSMALSSVKINPQDTIKTSNPPTPSPLGRSNSTGNVSNQGNAGLTDPDTCRLATQDLQIYRHLESRHTVTCLYRYVDIPCCRHVDPDTCRLESRHTVTCLYRYVDIHCSRHVDIYSDIQTCI